MDVSRYSSIIVAVVIGAALVACASVVTQGVVHIKAPNDIIRITGSARKIIRSDLITWHAKITARDAKMDAAYQSLRAGVAKTQAYLLKHGLTANEVTISPTETETFYAPLPKGQADYGSSIFRPITGYRLTQEVVVQSSQVELVDKLARSVTDLMGGGIQIESLAPEYLYTKLGELKVEMLAAAAKDARQRADQVAQNSGCHVARVRYAQMGVMRIIPAYTTSENAEGTYDTTTLDKEIVAVVSAGFSIR